MASMLRVLTLMFSMEIRVGRLKGGIASVPVRLRLGFVRSVRAVGAGEWAPTRVRTAIERAAKVGVEKRMVATIGNE